MSVPFRLSLDFAQGAITLPSRKQLREPQRLPQTIAATILGAAIAMSSVAAAAEAMSGYRWKHRSIVVLADHGGDLVLAERAIVVVWIGADTVRADLGSGPGLTAAQLRACFGASATGFRVVFVGKDGGVKLAQSSPLSKAALFGTIHEMPVRRDELRRNR